MLQSHDQRIPELMEDSPHGVGGEQIALKHESHHAPRTGESAPGILVALKNNLHYKSDFWVRGFHRREGVSERVEFQSVVVCSRL